jgi:hypothetical protein
MAQMDVGHDQTAMVRIEARVNAVILTSHRLTSQSQPWWQGNVGAGYQDGIRIGSLEGKSGMQESLNLYDVSAPSTLASPMSTSRGDSASDGSRAFPAADAQLGEMQLQQAFTPQHWSPQQWSQ